MKRNDGGSAFPVDASCYPIVIKNPGMSLRDYFAGQALCGMLASEQDGCFYETESCAVRAYKFADAMIAEREKE